MLAKTTMKWVFIYLFESTANSTELWSETPGIIFADLERQVLSYRSNSE